MVRCGNEEELGEQTDPDDHVSSVATQAPHEDSTSQSSLINSPLSSLAIADSVEEHLDSQGQESASPKPVSEARQDPGAAASTLHDEVIHNFEFVHYTDHVDKNASSNGPGR